MWSDLVLYYKELLKGSDKIPRIQLRAALDLELHRNLEF